MLQVRVGSNISSAEMYVIDQIFNHFWSIRYEVIYDQSLNEQYYNISDKYSNSLILLPRIFFTLFERFPFEEITLPNLPLDFLNVSNYISGANVIDDNIPVLYGFDKSLDPIKSGCDFPIDIFGSLFFLLSRYEELVVAKRDFHGRFSAYNSVAFKANFIHRPLGDEYLEILWAFLINKKCDLERRKSLYNFILTCDVDTPFESYVYSFNVLFKKIYNSIFKEKNFKELVRVAGNFLFSRVKYYKLDVYDKFDYILGFAKKCLKNPVVFYFLVDIYDSKYKGNYKIYSSRILSLLKKLSLEGCVIGSHGSYISAFQKDIFGQEVSSLLSVLKRLKLDPELLEVRQHYLRWSHVTLNNYPSYIRFIDSTLGYADYPGFRCGTCKEFYLYSFELKRAINVIERPLIVMENSVISSSYLGIEDVYESFDLIKRLSDSCRKMNGNFVLLWHNSSLSSKFEIDLFEKCIKELT